MASSSNNGSTFMWDNFIVFESNSSNSSFSSDDGMQKMFADVDRKKQCAFIAIVVAANSSNMFDANELEEGASHLVDSSVGVWDVLATMQATPRLFKILTNFTLVKFDELVLLITPTIAPCTIYKWTSHSSFGFNIYIKVLV